MVSKTKEVLDLNYLEEICKELKLRYAVLTDEEGTNGIVLEFSNKKGDELKIFLNMDVENARFYMMIEDILSLDKIKVSKENLFEDLMFMNAERVLYGNLGYLKEENEIIYTNTVSLEKRTDFRKEELFDYIAYAIFIRKIVQDKYYEKADLG
ncbi:hypothetical protein [Bacillus anthracis]|uniref:hypothetical protein n=1 Tax=Bacillus anthracis TaxID=1392 RepID=UPI002542080C|nr:hypothetical protein [Bacillus anthracis]WIG19499.1 hypothetical protein QPL80_00505 [Bacillus anthracis]